MQVKTTAIVSLYTSRLLGDMDGMYDACEALCHERPETVALSRFADELSPYLADQLDWLPNLDMSSVHDPVTGELMANDLITRYGEFLDLDPMPVDDHDFLPPELDVWAVNPKIQILDLNDFQEEEE